MLPCPANECFSEAVLGETSLADFLCEKFNNGPTWLLTGDLFYIPSQFVFCYGNKCFLRRSSISGLLTSPV